MTRVAIPIFRLRISPVFDFCTRVLLVDIEKNVVVDRKELYLDALSLTERVRILRKSGVTAVICSGISSALENLILSEKVELICNISGEIETVLQAYLDKRLDDSRFHMPGYHTHKKGINAKEKDYETR